MSSNNQRRRRNFTFLLLSFSILAGSAYVLGWSPILSLQKTEIKGTQEFDQIKSQLLKTNPELVIGEPMARLNLSGAKKSLLSLSWTKSVALHRDWFKRELTINITERVPVAIFNQDSAGTLNSNEIRYLDNDGVEFGSAKPVFNLPRITLPNSDLELRKNAALFIATMPVEILSSLKGLSVSPDGNVTMNSSLRSPGLEIRWGNGEELATKIEVLQRLLALPENKKITTVDLRNATAPIVK